MLNPNDNIQVQINPQSSNQLLQAAQVLEQNDSRVMIMFYNDHIYDVVDPPCEVLVFFKLEGHFVRQGAVLENIIDTSKARLAACQLQGPVEPAENRECFRAITVLQDLEALVDNKEKCDILDVSASGLAIKSKMERFMDQKVTIALEHEGAIYFGPARIRNIRKMAHGFYRYGLVCVDARSSSDSLGKGLNTISMYIQREQLKRLAGQNR